MYSVSEPIIGNLFEHIYNIDSLKEQICRTYFHQLIEGLEYCHSQQIFLLNLKPDYLFLDNQFRLKLGNFWTAVIGNQGSEEEVIINNFDIEKNQ